MALLSGDQITPISTMIFFKQRRAGVLAGDTPKYDLSWIPVLGWLATLIILTLISIFANSNGWNEGATTILDLAKIFTGAGIGAIYGESQTK
jgi:hypothetical protein